MAALALDSRGEFVLPGLTADAWPVLSETDARALAVAWAHTFGPFVRKRLERQHGGPIDLAELNACRRVYAAESPYTLPPSGLPNSVRNVIGPWWLVPLCSSAGVTQVNVGVAATATDVSVENGSINFPTHSGGEFFAEGVPPGTSVPMTPEEAVTRVAETTGAIVARVPELILPGRPFAPQLARWRIVLDRPVPVRGSKSGVVSNALELYVGRNGIEVSWPPQADSAAGRTHTIRYAVPRNHSSEQLRSASLSISIPAGRYVHFEPVVAAAGGGR